MEKLKKAHEHDDGTSDAEVLVHYFNPTGQGDWYIVDIDNDEDTMFGLCCLDYAELGYVSLNELKSIKVRMGLGIERDIHWNVKKISECTQEAHKKGYLGI
jgi:hypothetical protein